MVGAAGVDLAGRTVIVTGGNGRVGAGISRRFASAGANVVIHHHGPATPALDDLLESIGGAPARAVRGDIRDEHDCAAIVDAALDAFGDLHALVNAAGVQPVQRLSEISADQWRDVVDVNLTGTFLMTRAAAAAMADRGGSITHIASVQASLPAVGHGHYAASKAAVVMHARAAALELGSRGIRVNSVSPGLVDDGDLARRWPDGLDSWLRAAPLARAATPEDIGNACVFLASPMAAFITGHDLVVDGGMSAVPPW